MRKTEAIEFFGGNISAMAAALGIDQSSVYSWGDFPPVVRQIQLQRITRGKLRAEPIPSPAKRVKKARAA